VYVTCSMLSRENEASVTAFEAAHPEFAPVAVAEALSDAALNADGAATLAAKADGHRLRLSPASTNTDGFFVAIYERAS
ncbi:MAG: RsmB/NOP family class I SAM-dependent RNA methyltransferase, partial [Brevundimonas sp.]|nr:RsmB/NOP family class I SAM-dependent RNA methyltransferase [Brevundimonas sp.]